MEDDIVEHSDILSGPSQRAPGTPKRTVIGLRRKHNSPSKKSLLETLAIAAAVASKSDTNQAPDDLPEPKLKRELSTDFDSNTSPPKRRRGRPRKNKVEGEVATVTVKRKVGRPRKIKPEGEDVIPLKRKPGRPRIIDVQDPPVKRKPGRPRKIIDPSGGTLQTDRKAKKEIVGDLTTTNLLPKTFKRPKKTLIDAEALREELADGGELDDESDEFIGNSSTGSSELPSSPMFDGMRPSTKSSHASKSISELNTPLKPGKNFTQNLNRDFISPLKKMVLDNLGEFAGNTSTEHRRPELALKLDKNFVATPLQYNRADRNKTAVGKAEADGFESFKKSNDFFDTYEGYFDQKRTKAVNKKSKSSMAAAPDVTRAEFATISEVFNKRFLKDKRKKLFEIQKKLFTQFWFEVTQGFTLLFYGIGSKRNFLESFALNYLSKKLALPGISWNGQTAGGKTINGIPCVVINGYNPTCNYRDIFYDISKLTLPEEITKAETKFWGNHVMLSISKMVEFYKTQPADIKLILVVHNLDGPSVRRDAFQEMLSSLASIKQIAVVASTDNVSAPLLWDNGLSQNFNFVYHDVTNFEPNTIESTFQDVMKIGAKETSSGIEGVRYVLESLTSNSKRLYKTIITAQLTKIDADADAQKKHAVSNGGLKLGVEFKRLLQQCAEDFIASNEISLRTMLREFIEHKMVITKKNANGTEVVWIPFTVSDLRKILSTLLNNVE
ncbi:origin recognition complex subunit 2 KNAG_0J00830 [Huiozyma naganishii CBS 8797]|uniref:Origin recognition complex subunit 2 n=1 Tax=Huiozyma naganishii (strain ATCC MYA-139 / BCRC 22969 / CBS 8797 / KCTC 17520 / NBRC 10181 / NCYC 3082 / Yp74L-3) TaxID=1071383 RepID=J7RBB3_HUIN7|nr:hypothetical protein KNAG_0J00830 [Kazachstania naganishii CBS 8797]CCK72165.1 hypothetical protein KNAG_0J00830 [Kazachstania naganishii CBS 8797]